MDNKKKVRNLLLYLGIPILIIIITAAVLSTNKSTSPKTSELEQYFVQDMVDSFNIDYGSGQIEITLKEGMSPIKSTDSDSQSATTATQTATEQQETRSNSKKSKIVVKGQLADIQRFLDDIKPYYNPASTDEIPHNLTRATDNSILMEMIPTLIIMIILIVAWVLIMKKMGGGNSMMFNMGKSNAKVYVKSDEGIKYDDVAGEDEAKENLQEVVNYLHDPSKYQAIGASMPKGILLVGPPGTAKTMLAKAVAGEANVPFFSMSGSEFVEMFVGMGASKVRDLFRQAKEKAPCIVFIDEIDAIGKKRDGQLGGNDEREQTLNQLLTEMDGFEGNTGVIILAATNRPESLDPALTRPGRFDRRVPVELPDLKGREEILKVHAKKIKIAEDVDFNKVARMASGASGAELANIVNEAALRAVRDGRRFATQADLEESIEVVIAGYQKKNAIMTDHEKKIVSYHEIGHALVAAMQTHSAPVQKITIVPRTSGALGYTMQVEEGNHNLMTKEEMYNKIATLTGGRAAEEVAFGSVTTGASNDIEQATKLARAMITRYGMSDDFGMVALETVTNQYLGGDASVACSADTQTKIDQQVVELVKREHDKAVDILTANREKLDRLAAFLYEKETITGEEFMHILGE